MGEAGGKARLMSMKDSPTIGLYGVYNDISQWSVQHDCSTNKTELSQPKKEEFKNVINGVEQARLIAQKLKAQKSAIPSPKNTQGFRATSFEVGNKVFHDKFGTGEITDIVNIGNSTLYKVEFKKYGIKAVDAEFNKMTLID